MPVRYLGRQGSGSGLHTRTVNPRGLRSSAERLEITSTGNGDSELSGDPKLPSLSPIEISAVRCGEIAG
jgi:hypothetical protein